MTSLNVPSPRLEIKRYFLISLSCTFGRGWWTSRTRTPRRSLQGKSSLMFSCQVAKFCQNEEKLMRLCFLKATRIQLRSRESQGVAKLLSLKLGCWKLLWCVCFKLHSFTGWIFTLLLRKGKLSFSKFQPGWLSLVDRGKETKKFSLLLLWSRLGPSKRIQEDGGGSARRTEERGIKKQISSSERNQKIPSASSSVWGKSSCYLNTEPKWRQKTGPRREFKRTHFHLRSE